MRRLFGRPKLTPVRLTHRIPFQGLRDTLRIAVLADIHACRPWMSLSRIAALVEEANALDVDLIALLGDYAGHVLLSPQEPALDVARLLAGLKAPLGVFAVMGNHDWKKRTKGDRSTRWHRAFEDAGIEMLNNRAVTLSHGGTEIPLAGIDSLRAYGRPRQGRDRGAHDLDRALAGLDPARPAILLSHEPDIFPEIRDPVHLVLSGHTHGGQIRAFGRSWVVPSRYGRRYDWGHIEERGRHLVVSGGLGYSGLPLRIGVPPEITLVELRS